MKLSSGFPGNSSTPRDARGAKGRTRSCSGRLALPCGAGSRLSLQGADSSAHRCTDSVVLLLLLLLLVEFQARSPRAFTARPSTPVSNVKIRRGNTTRAAHHAEAVDSMAAVPRHRFCRLWLSCFLVLLRFTRVFSAAAPLLVARYKPRAQ